MPLPLYFEPVEIAAACVALGFKLFCEDEPIFKGIFKVRIRAHDFALV